MAVTITEVWQTIIDSLVQKVQQAQSPDEAEKWIELLMKVTDRHERAQEREKALAKSSVPTAPDLRE